MTTSHIKEAIEQRMQELERQMDRSRAYAKTIRYEDPETDAEIQGELNAQHNELVWLRRLLTQLEE